jgi:uncharacterized protein YraI
MPKRKMRFLRILVPLLVVMLAVPLAATLAQEGGVTATAKSGLQIRSGAGTGYASLGTVPIGTTAPVLGRNAGGDWLLVEYESVRGWVAGWLATVSGDLNAVPVTDEVIGSPVWVTTQTAVKMRSGPGLEYDELGSGVPSLVNLPMLGRTADSAWFLVEYGGARGWVAGWLCWINGDLSLVPITDEAGTPGEAPPAPSPPTPETPPAEQPPPAPEGVTATPRNYLNMRSGPGTAYSTLGTAPAGVALPVLGRNPDSSWVFVEYQAQQGWLAAWLCDITGDLNTVSIKEAPAGGEVPPPPPPPPSAPSAGGKFMLGGQTHSMAHPGEMAHAGMTWVKFQHKWAPGQNASDVAGRINDAHAHGFKVLLSIPGPSNPLSIDFGAYVEYLGGVAALGADGIEVWNEMNLDREWPVGQISPASYVYNMLAPAYGAIKAANPNTLVVGGAPAPTGFHNGINVWSDDVYIAGMRDAGAANYMDCMGVHYNAGATPPDATSGHPADPGAGHYSWYFWPTYHLYAGTFSKSDLCFTELGYVTGEGYGPLPPNFWWGLNTSVASQAAWLARSAELLRGTNRVRLMIVFNVDFTQWDDDPQAGYAMIRPGGGCPACDALHDVMY